MSATLPGMAHEARDAAKSQWFTSPELAARLWRWGHWGRSHSVAPIALLEPAAGLGALIWPAVTDPTAKIESVVAYELDREMRQRLLWDNRWPAELPYAVRPEDFLADRDGGERFDVAVLNPPFEDNQDVAFAEKCCGCSTYVFGIFASRIVHSKGREAFWRWHDPIRVAWMAGRPSFGGDFTPKTDFIALELKRRRQARKQGEPTTSCVEWWA